MFGPLVTFPALYTATLLMLAGSGLFSTYMGLRLTEEGVGDFWVGGLMAAYYFGLVCGGKVGHRLIASVGHIRSYVACAGLATVIVLLHVLVEQLEVWLLLRFVMGAVMMNQYMVIESWLNEQSENHMRGKVFAGYMVAVDLGLVVGQGLLALSPTLDYKPLLLVAICFASCLIPLAVTRRVHPAKLVAAPLEIGFFWKRVPQAMGTIFVAGLMVGAFYGLAPVYASRSGLDTSQASMFVGMCIVAGFCAQWPLGWLSDRVDRSWLIRGNAILLCLAAIPMWGLFDLPYGLLLVNGFVTGMLLFTLYPLAVALGNDHVVVGHAADHLWRGGLYRAAVRRGADAQLRPGHVLRAGVGLCAGADLLGAAEAGDRLAPRRRGTTEPRADAGYGQPHGRRARSACGGGAGGAGGGSPGGHWPLRWCA